MKFIKYIIPCAFASLAVAQRAGDRLPVVGMNPAYSVTNIRPPGMTWPIGGMDFMSDGRLVVTSWTDPYGVFIISNSIEGASPKTSTVTQFATGLSEALGVKVVNDSIYVLEKDQVTLLLDHNNVGTADEYRAIGYDWTKSVNEKEYAVGLAYDGTYFYAIFGDPTIDNATSIDPEPAGRLNGCIRIRRSDGLTQPFSAGMRVPGGIDMAWGVPWVTETQGGYRVSHVLYTPKYGAYYGRPVNPAPMFQPAAAPNPNTNGNPYTSPAQMAASFTPFSVNIPFKNTSASSGSGGSASPNGLMRTPGNPILLSTGPYAGELLIPEADKEVTPGPGEMARIFLEITPDGAYQGAAFHFAAANIFSDTGVYSIKQGPDGNLYCGGNGSKAAGWGRVTNIGLDRMALTGTTPFDMLAVRSTGVNTFDIQFTKPLATSLGSTLPTADVVVEKYWDEESNTYGCCRVGTTTLAVSSAAISADRLHVTLTFASGVLTANWIYYFRFTDAVTTDAAEKLWGTEAWYTLNSFGPATTPVAINDNRPLTTGMAPFKVSRMGGNLQVQLSIPDAAPYDLQVTDLSGRIFLRRSGHGSGQVSLPQSMIPSGLYVLKVHTGSQTYSRLGMQ